VEDINMAICGKDCTFSIDGAAVSEGTTFNIDLNSQEEDVRAFGSPVLGSWLACARSGVVTLTSYADNGVEDGDVVDLVATEGNPVVKTQTMTAAVCTAFNIAVDAKGIVTYNNTFRLTNYVAS